MSLHTQGTRRALGVMGHRLGGSGSASPAWVRGGVRGLF